MTLNIGSTYSRYPGQSPNRFPLETDQKPKSEVPQEPKRPLRRSGANRAVPALTAVERNQQLNDMVLRLNHRSELVQSPFRFTIENGKAGARIVMQDSERVLNRFEWNEIIELERNLFHMSGFQFSIEG